MMAQTKYVAMLGLDRVQIVAPDHLNATMIAALAARGVEARSTRHIEGDDLVAYAFETAPTPDMAVELAAAAAHAAGTGRPICCLVPPQRGSGRAAAERTAAVSFLRVHGAVVTHDVDAWLEAIVTIVRFGLPRGPRAAVIAPPGSWLEAQTLALISEAEVAGTRAPQLVTTKTAHAVDAILFDPVLGTAPTQFPGLHVPVIARGELGGGEPALYGMRAALAAVDGLGLAAERIAVGLGPAPVAERGELAIDDTRFERQWAKLARGSRVGDHETKVLLAAYGVPITRQAVALTPSAAVRAARRAGYPVELKPWGHHVPTETAGCPVERDVTSDALVRRAFSTVLAAAGKTPNSSDGAVIVREPPPLGRDLAVQFVRLPSLGWTTVLEIPGASQIATCPAPLRMADASALAAAMVASRAADPEPDRAGLANLLRRASFIVADVDTRIVRLELPRVVVGGRGARTVVVDAWCELA